MSDRELGPGLRSGIFPTPDCKPSGGSLYQYAEITEEARQLIRDTMAACGHHDRAVARGTAAGAVARTFGVGRSTALRWAMEVPDPVTPGTEPAEPYPE